MEECSREESGGRSQLLYGRRELNVEWGGNRSKENLRREDGYGKGNGERFDVRKDDKRDTRGEREGMIWLKKRKAQIETPEIRKEGLATCLKTENEGGAS